MSDKCTTTPKVPCPCCDIEQRYSGKLECFALGVSLGAAFAADTHAVTELMCPKHRGLYVLAMCRAAVHVNGGDTCYEGVFDAEGS